MTSPVIASAAVEIAPILTNFGQRLSSDIKNATRDASRTAADAGRQIGGSFDDAAKQTNRLSGSLARMSEIAGGITLADVFQDVSRAAGQLLTGATQAASSLEQSLGAVDSVFKSSAGTINEWGQTSAESFGLSQRAFNEAVTPVGAMLQNLGFSLEETTTQTGQLTERAADMAATFGGPTKDALDAIQAALRGETDPIERYGVLLNEATVNARALADTGKASADSLTLQEKATARLNLIMEQTAATQGQFAREADTVAGAQQRLTAAWEDARAAIGESFAPVVRLAADVLTALLDVFQQLPKPIQAVISVAAVFVAGIVAIAPAVTAAATAMGALGVSATTLGTTLRGVGSFLLGPWGVAIGGAAAAVGLFAMSQQKALNDVEKFTYAVDAQTDQLTGETVAGFRKFWDELKGGPNGQTDVSEAAKFVGVAYRDVVDAINDSGAARERVNRIIQDNIDKGGIERAQAMDLRGALEAQYQARDEAARAARDQAGASQTVVETAKQELDVLHMINDALLAQRDAHRGLQAAIDEANATIVKNGENLDINTEKGRGNQAALDGIVASTFAAIEADRQKGVSGVALAGTLEIGRQAFIAAAEAAGLESSAAIKLASDLGLIPERVLTTYELDAARASSTFQYIMNQIANIPANIRSDYYLYTHFMGNLNPRNFDPTYGGYGGMARGGPARVGQWTWVGEEGPELVRWGRAARVYSTDESERMATDVGQLDAMTSRGGSDRSTAERASTSAPSPVELTNNVDVQPAIHIYLDSRELNGVVERVVIGREQRLHRLIDSGTGRR